MKQSVNFCDFTDAFRDCDRNANFSYEGKRALFDYLEQLEEDLDEEIELDVIALCCEYSEDSLAEIADKYSNCIERNSDETDEDFAERLKDWMTENTLVLDVGEPCGNLADIVVYQQF